MSGNCKFCLYVYPKESGNPDVTFYDCRRFPPVGFMAVVQVKATPTNPQGIQNAPASVWPPVTEGQWCGEYAPKAYKGNAPS